MNSSHDTGTLNFYWSQALIEGLVAAGLLRAVISPGSRSTPLALALLRDPGIRVDVLVDERCAAFFALGIAKASQQPVVLLATSGTAIANWLPAVVEASQASVPLILISADRPPSLQGLGANQTIPQCGIFGGFVRATHELGVPDPDFNSAYLHALGARIVQQACWPLPGPVHVNQAFHEPLLPIEPTKPSTRIYAIRVSQPTMSPDPDAIRQLSEIISGRPGLIVCGEMSQEPGFATSVTALARHLGCAIFAEPLSGLRFGSHDRSQILCSYDDIEEIRQPEWILRFGAVPVTRALQNLLDQHRGNMVLVDPWPRWNDPFSRLTHLIHASPLATCQALLGSAPAPCPAAWLAHWPSTTVDTISDPYGQLIRQCIDQLPADCPVFIGNSLAIRMLDKYSGSDEKPLAFFANRGASGIDGNVSTALGIASACGRILALLGDLTCQHDLGGLAAARGRDAIIVVINNGGGRIFEHLPQHKLPEFEAAWLTPQQLDFQAAAKTFGLSYAATQVTNNSFVEALQNALAVGGPHLLEVILNS